MHTEPTTVRRGVIVGLNALVVACALGACGGGGGSGAELDLPWVAVTEPANDVTVRASPAGTVEIRFTEHDPTGEGLIDVVVDRDGLPYSTNDQIVIASDLVPEDGAEHVVSWFVEGAVAADYVVFVRLRFGDDREIIGTGPGRVHVNRPPDLSLAGPPLRTQVSRGGLLCYGYDVFDPDDQPTVRLTLDADGDPVTEDDAYALELPTRGPGCTPRSMPIVPYGAYALTGVADDGFNDPVVVAGAGLIDVVDVSWATSLGGDGFEIVSSLVVYADGSSLVAGRFEAAFTLAAGQPNETTLTPKGGRDMFLTRLNADGSMRWAKGLGSLGDDSAGGLAKLGDGGFVLTGRFEEEMTLGAGEPTQTTLHAANDSIDRFVARFNASGGLVWALRKGGAAFDGGGSVASFPDASAVTVSGSVDNSAAPEDRTIGTLERYNANGDMAWSRTLTGTGVANAFVAVAAYENGDTLTTGTWDGEIILGKGEANETTLTSTEAGGVRQAFIAKYDSDGSLMWARRMTGAGEVFAGRPAILDDGSFVTAGYFAGTATWGHGEPGELQRTSAGASDGFVAKYSADGTFQWVRLTGSPVAPAGGPAGSGEDNLIDIVVLADGSFVVTGNVKGPTTVESTDAPRSLPLNYSFSTAICIRYQPDGTVIWVRTDSIDPADGLVFAQLVGAAADGSCLCAGVFYNDVQFGAADDTPASVASPTDEMDVYVTRLNADGKY